MHPALGHTPATTVRACKHAAAAAGRVTGRLQSTCLRQELEVAGWRPAGASGELLQRQAVVVHRLVIRRVRRRRRRIPLRRQGELPAPADSGMRCSRA